jgi:Domain of unknown function (DUF4267)
MIGRSESPDPLARALALAIGAGRIAIGAGVLLAPQASLRALGFPATDASGKALAKLAGGRDVALGALALAARDDREALRSACIAGIAADAGDALSLGSAAARGESLGHAGTLGAASGAAAALAGTWAVNRLSEGR